MASDRDAFGKETAGAAERLAEALKVSARQERVLTPTGENEIAAIVVHRLFEQVDRSAVPGCDAALRRLLTTSSTNKVRPCTTGRCAVTTCKSSRPRIPSTRS